jgi:cyclin-dependent kinase 2
MVGCGGEICLLGEGKQDGGTNVRFLAARAEGFRIRFELLRVQGLNSRRCSQFPFTFFATAMSLHSFFAVSADLLGEGTFGQVFAASLKADGRHVAVKVYKDKEAMEELRHESHMLRVLASPHVVALLAIFPDKGDVSAVLELATSSLSVFTRAKQPEQQPAVQRVMAQVTAALAYCHERGVAHRDVKPANILVFGNLVDGKVKLADFGASSFQGLDGVVKVSGDIGTLPYRAPELLLGVTEHTVAVDMWSLGCVLYELSQCRPLVDDPWRSKLSTLWKLFSMFGVPSNESWPGVATLPHFSGNFPRWKLVSESDRGLLVPGLGPDGADLFAKLLSIFPDGRLSSREALRHSFVQDQGPSFLGKALKLHKEWVDAILDGKPPKVWELRGTPCHARGTFGLAETKLFSVVGEATVVDCILVGTRDEKGVIVAGNGVAPDNFVGLPENVRKHRVVVWQKIAYQKIYAWVLQSPVRYTCPVPVPPTSAQVWLTLPTDFVRGQGHHGGLAHSVSSFSEGCSAEYFSPSNSLWIRCSVTKVNPENSTCHVKLKSGQLRPSVPIDRLRLPNDVVMVEQPSATSAGLHNHGNTCFVAAVCRLLFDAGIYGKKNTTFHDLCASFLANANHDVKFSWLALLNELRQAGQVKGTMGDASEMLAWLLEHQVALLQQSDFVLQRPKTCERCSCVTARDYHFQSVFVNMAQSGGNSLQERLDDFFGSDDDFLVRCLGCQANQMHHAGQAVVVKAPSVLLVIVCRWKDYRAAQGAKLRAPLAIPDEVSAFEQRWSLKNVVLHIGVTKEGGHYIDCRRTGSEWVVFDDAVTHKASSLAGTYLKVPFSLEEDATVLLFLRQNMEGAGEAKLAMAAGYAIDISSSREGIPAKKPHGKIAEVHTNKAGEKETEAASHVSGESAFAEKAAEMELETLGGLGTVASDARGKIDDEGAGADNLLAGEIACREAGEFKETAEAQNEGENAIKAANGDVNASQFERKDSLQAPKDAGLAGGVENAVELPQAIVKLTRPKGRGGGGGFFSFLSEQQGALTEQLKDRFKGMKLRQEVTKIVGGRWQQLPKEAREAYKKRCASEGPATAQADSREGAASKPAKRARLDDGRIQAGKRRGGGSGFFSFMKSRQAALMEELKEGFRGRDLRQEVCKRAGRLWQELPEETRHAYAVQGK